MFFHIFFLVVGFIALIKGADIFVEGASSIAKNFKVSKALIGLTIVAFGTSLPEFAVSIQAMLNKSTDMILGNVVGSNIINGMLIIGVAAILSPIKIPRNTIRKELPLCLLISTLLAVLFMDKSINNALINSITRGDAIVILLFFLIFFYYLITLAKRDKDNSIEKPKYGTFKSFVVTVLGLFSVIIGSEVVVNSATSIARIVGISEKIISLTVIAFGTSLPELMTTISSSKKEEQELLLGNIIGSNIFNICIVLGLPTALFGNLVTKNFNMLDMFALIFSTIALFLFAKTDNKITKKEGITLIILFLMYYIITIV